MSGRKTTRGHVLWAIVGALLVVGIAVFALAWDAERPTRLIENPTVIIGGVISGLGLVLAAILPTLLRVDRVTNVIRDNVQNSHALPLREEQDERHGELMRAVARLETGLVSLGKAVEGQASDIRGIRRDIGRTMDEQDRMGGILTAVIERVGTAEKAIINIRHDCCKEKP